MGIANKNLWGKKIESIDITLENCESYKLPMECVDYMMAEGAKEFISTQRDRIFQYTTVDKFFIRIVKPERIIEEQTWSGSFAKRVAFSNDITQIHIHYKNGKSQWFCVPWHEEDEYQNRWQKNQVLEDGTLTISICRNGEHVENIFG